MVLYPRLIGRFGRNLGRRVSTAVSGFRGRTFEFPKEFSPTAVNLSIPLVFVGAFSANTLIQHYFGTKADFFRGSFVTDKDEDDIAKFYQSEDSLKLLAVHPFLYYLFMDRAKKGEPPESEEEMHFSMDENRMVVQKIGMEVSFERFEERQEIDGKTVRTCFERHERFLQYVPMLYDYGIKIPLWDQTWTFGFRNLEDGRTEVYHAGLFFWGPWPVRVIIHLHQKYLLWACKDLITSGALISNDNDAMQSREDIVMPNVVGVIGKVGRWMVSELDEAVENVVRRWLLPSILSSNALQGIRFA